MAGHKSNAGGSSSSLPDSTFVPHAEKNQAPWSRNRQTTVMIVGNSGSGKSTLGNLLLNLGTGGEDEEEEETVYFAEGDGATGATPGFQQAVSKDGNFKVIDTPGAPNPESKEDTLDYVDAIVKEMRRADGINLMIFLGQQRRVNPREFRAYRILLNQLTLVPGATLLVCRQPEYSRRPTEEMKVAKRNGGQAWLNEVLQKSGLAMPTMLLMSGRGDDARKSIAEIAEIARCAPPGTNRMALSNLRTYRELQALERKLSGELFRLKALAREVEALKASVISKREWAVKMRITGGCLVGAGCISAFFPKTTTVVVSFVATGVASLALSVYLAHNAGNPQIEQKIDTYEREIRSGRPEEIQERLHRTQEELDEVNSLWARF